MLSVGLLAPVALSPTPASAASSKFCAAVFDFTKYPTSPTSFTVTGFHTWAKKLLPYYENLEANAPNATSKSVLKEIVTILKYYETSASVAKLTAYQSAHRATWLAGTKVLGKAIASCAKSMG
jgi:hypothetical protein